MKTSLIIFLLAVFCEAKGQIITTFAGTGSSTYAGEGVAATTAGISNPRGGAFDKYGNYYFADGSSNRIRKINSLGIISTVAGNGFGGFSGDGTIATTAKLNAPVAVAVDTSGNIYIADGGYRIRKVSAVTGIISTVAGNGSSAFGGDNGPSTSASLVYPADLCVDYFSNILIIDGYRIRKINVLGIITTVAGGSVPGSTGDGGAATNALLNNPSGLTVDHAGNIFIAERVGNKVRKINSSNIITTYAGNGSPSYIGDGISASSAQIVPYKVGVDTANQLYVADDYNERIYKVDNAGILHLIAGNGIAGYLGDNGPASAAELHSPAGIAVDPCGNVYIPEVDNYRVRKITFNPTCNFSGLLVDTNNSEVTNVSIFPNPTINTFHIIAGWKINELTITNFLGQTVYSIHPDACEVDVNILYLTQGLYVVTLKNDAEQKIYRSLLKH
jgi:trimeric autotransporter adhesin